MTRHVAEGGPGALELAEVVIEAARRAHDFEFLYPLDLPLDQKIETIATQIYGADGIDVSPAAAGRSRTTSGSASAACRSSSPRRTCRSRRTPP